MENAGTADPDPPRPTGKPSGTVNPSGAMAELRRRWRGGERVLVEAVLRHHPELAGDRHAVLDLVYQEIVLREEAGEAVDPQEYLQRFRDYSGELSALFDAHGAGRSDLGRGAEPSTARSGRETFSARIASDLGDPPAGNSLPMIPGFQFLQRVGQGGMGTVYKARQVALDRVVAIKVVRPDRASHWPEALRMRAEALAAARLQHPHIVQLFEMGDHAGLEYLVLEFVEGGNLAQRLRETPLAAAEAARLLCSVSRAVHYAHERHLVHRDLKPANILLTPAGVPKVADFGLAKRLDLEASQTASGTVAGTPGYMAPEQIDHRRAIGPATDVYGLGAVLYETLTGRPPFRAASFGETLQQVLLEDPIPCRALRPGLPRDLETICHRCLEKQPQKRYATAAHLADDLERFLAGEPILARPISAWERLLKWCRRRPAAAALLASVALFLLTAAGLLAWRAESLSREQQKTLANYGRAVEQEQKARRNLDAALLAVEQLLTYLADGAQFLTASGPFIDGLYARGIELLAPIAAEYPSEPRAQLLLARLHQSLAVRQDSQGQGEDAMSRIAEAQRIIDRLLEAHPTSQVRAKRAEILRAHAQILVNTSQFERGLEFSDQAVAEAETLLAAEPDVKEHNYRKAQMLGARGDNRRKRLAVGPPAPELFAAAEEDLSAAINMAQQLVDADTLLPLSAQLLAECATALANLHDLSGQLAASAGNLEEAKASNRRAEAQYARAVSMWQDLSRRHPQAPPYLRWLVDAHRAYAAWSRQFDPDRLAQRLADAIQAAERLAREDPADQLNRLRLARERCYLANLILTAADAGLDRHERVDQVAVRRAADLGQLALAELRNLSAIVADRQELLRDEPIPTEILLWAHALLGEFDESEDWARRLGELAELGLAAHLQVAENFAYLDGLARRLPTADADALAPRRQSWRKRAVKHLHRAAGNQGVPREDILALKHLSRMQDTDEMREFLSGLPPEPPRPATAPHR